MTTQGTTRFAVASAPAVAAAAVLATLVVGLAVVLLPAIRQALN